MFKCNKCKWVGNECLINDDLLAVCPNCKTDKDLIDEPTN